MGMGDFASESLVDRIHTRMTSAMMDLMKGLMKVPDEGKMRDQMKIFFWLCQ